MSLLCKALRFLLNIADATLGVLTDVLELVVDSAGELISSVGNTVSDMFSMGGTTKLLVLGVGLWWLMSMSSDNDTDKEVLANG